MMPPTLLMRHAVAPPLDDYFRCLLCAMMLYAVIAMPLILPLRFSPPATPPHSAITRERGYRAAFAAMISLF